MPISLRKIPTVFAYLQLDEKLYELKDRNAVETYDIKLDDMLRIDNLGILRVVSITRYPFHDKHGHLVNEIAIEVERLGWRG